MNVALRKPVSQSDTLTWGGFTWIADKAVDGCLQRNDPNKQKCCSCSSKDGKVVDWRLNLTKEYRVERITIYGRTDPRKLF